MSAALRIALACAWLAVGMAPGQAQQSRGQSWPDIKCERYGRAWAELLAKRGRTGLGAEFIAAHEAFLATGCPTPGSVCPRSKEELELANILVVMAMNAGTASTFLPFACRK